MGAYLSTPCVEKKSDDFSESEKFSYGVSGMQGWRISMEDAHNCVPSLEENTSLFGVYDGHGGSEVASYCALHFSDVLKASDHYKEENYEEALKETFMKIDKTLIEPEIIKELKVLADRDPEDGPPTDSDFKAKEEEEDYDEDETKLLYEEATMSIEELLARYGKAANETKSTIDKFKAESEKDSQDPSTGSSKNESSEMEVTDPVEATSSSSGSTERTSSTSMKAKPLSEDKCSSSASVTPEIPATGSVSKDSRSGGDTSGQSTDTSEPIGTENGPNEEKSAEESKSSVETADVDKAKGDKSESSTKTTNEKLKSAKIPATKIKPSKLRPLVAMEEIDDEEDSDSEDGFDSDEAVEGSSDSDEDEDDESSGDEDDIDISELPTTGLSSTVEEPGKDSGTTAVVALIHGRKLLVANAGDSRCVLSRKGKALDMSEDHKPEDEAEIKRIKAAGGHVNFQGRVNGGLNLSRAIGDHCYKTNVALELKDQMISAMPDIKSVHLQPGDEFMVLACDGIWNVFSSQEVIDFILPRLPTPETMKEKFKLSSICEELFDLSLAPDTTGDGTGCDNMTCVLVQFNQSWLEKCEAEDPSPTEDAPMLDSSINHSVPVNHNSTGDTVQVGNELGKPKDEIKISNNTNSELNKNGKESNTEDSTPGCKRMRTEIELIENTENGEEKARKRLKAEN